jgi:hypothetical protein
VPADLGAAPDAPPAPLLGAPVQRAGEPLAGTDGAEVISDEEPEPGPPLVARSTVEPPPADGWPAAPYDSGPGPDHADPLPVAPLLGAAPGTPTVTPAASGSASSAPAPSGPATSATPAVPVSRSLAPPPVSRQATRHTAPPMPSSALPSPAPGRPAAPVPAVQRSTTPPSGHQAGAQPDAMRTISDSFGPPDMQAAMIEAAFAGGAPPTVLRVPATQAPAGGTYPADPGNGAAAPLGAPAVPFTPIPVARQVAEESSPVPSNGPTSDQSFGAAAGAPPAAAAAQAGAQDTERLVAQLVGPLFERLRAELRRERIRRGSVHDRLG